MNTNHLSTPENDRSFPTSNFRFSPYRRTGQETKRTIFPHDTACMHDEAWSCLYVACMQTLMRWHWCHQRIHARQTHPTHNLAMALGSNLTGYQMLFSPIWSYTGNDGMGTLIIGLERQRHRTRLNELWTKRTFFVTS